MFHGSTVFCASLSSFMTWIIIMLTDSWHQGTEMASMVWVLQFMGFLYILIQIFRHGTSSKVYSFGIPMKPNACKGVFHSCNKISFQEVDGIIFLATTKGWIRRGFVKPAMRFPWKFYLAHNSEAADLRSYR